MKLVYGGKCDENLLDNPNDGEDVLWDLGFKKPSNPDLERKSEQIIMGDGHLSKNLDKALTKMNESFLSQPFLENLLINERKFNALVDWVSTYGLCFDENIFRDIDVDLLVENKMSFIKLELQRQGLEKLIVEFDSLVQAFRNVVENAKKTFKEVLKEQGHNNFFVRLAIGHVEDLSDLMTQISVVMVDLKLVVEGQKVMPNVDALSSEKLFNDIRNIKNNFSFLKALLNGKYDLGSVEVCELVMKRLSVSPYSLESLKGMENVLHNHNSSVKDLNNVKYEALIDFIDAESFELHEQLQKKTVSKKFQAVISGVRDSSVVKDFHLEMVGSNFSQAVGKIFDALPDSLILGKSILAAAKSNLVAGDFSEVELLLRMYKMVTHQNPQEISEDGLKAFVEWERISCIDEPAFLKIKLEQIRPKLTLVK